MQSGKCDKCGKRVTNGLVVVEFPLKPDEFHCRECRGLGNKKKKKKKPDVLKLVHYKIENGVVVNLTDSNK